MGVVTDDEARRPPRLRERPSRRRQAAPGEGGRAGAAPRLSLAGAFSAPWPCRRQYHFSESNEARVGRCFTFKLANQDI
jgi:hypothetical protein